MTPRDKRIQEERKADPQFNPHPRRRWWRTQFSSLFHRSATLHDESDDETDSSKENHKSRRVRPDMIRRIDDKPKLINPSGWISEGRMPTAQENPVESESIKSRSPTKEPEPTNPTSGQPPQITHLQPSHQQQSDLDGESGSELEDLNQLPPRSRTNRRVSDSGAFPYRKCTGQRHLLPVDIVPRLSAAKSPTFIPVPTSWPFYDSDSNRGIRPLPTS